LKRLELARQAEVFDAEGRDSPLNLTLVAATVVGLTIWFKTEVPKQKLM